MMGLGVRDSVAIVGMLVIMTPIFIIILVAINAAGTIHAASTGIVVEAVAAAIKAVTAAIKVVLGLVVAVMLRDCATATVTVIE